MAQVYGAVFLFLDMIMPGLSGRETYERSIKHQPKEKVLFIRGCSLDKEVEQSILLGITGVIKNHFPWKNSPGPSRRNCAGER